jgi:hypothetical protein
VNRLSKIGARRAVRVGKGLALGRRKRPVQAPKPVPFGAAKPPLEHTATFVGLLLVLVLIGHFSEAGVESGEAHLLLGLMVLGGGAYFLYRLRYVWRRRRGAFGDEPPRFAGALWRVHDGLVLAGALAAASVVVPIGLAAAAIVAVAFKCAIWLVDRWTERRLSLRRRR